MTDTRPDTGSDSTLDDVRSADAGPRRVWPRRAGVVLLVVIVLAGASGLLGVRSASRTVTGNGYVLTVEYAAVARAGLDVPWSVTVEHAGGFSGPVRLSASSAYFDLFESQGFDPEPAAETADADRVYWTFDPPPGEVFTLDFDAYVQPAAQLGASGTVAVDGGPSADFTTWLVP